MNRLQEICYHQKKGFEVSFFAHLKDGIFLTDSLRIFSSYQQISWRAIPVIFKV